MYTQVGERKNQKKTPQAKGWVQPMEAYRLTHPCIILSVYNVFMIYISSTVCLVRCYACMIYFAYSLAKKFNHFGLQLNLVYEIPPGMFQLTCLEGVEYNLIANVAKCCSACSPRFLCFVDHDLIFFIPMSFKGVFHWVLKVKFWENFLGC